MNFEFELTSTPLTSTAGLAFVGRQLDDPKFARHPASLIPHQRSRGRIPDADIVRTMIGLICVGKPHFDAAGDAFRDFTTRLLGGHNGLLTEEHRGRSWLTVNIDVTPMDNSGSHKEGVSCTCRKFDGYAPIFAYAGPHGFILNNQLRPGSSHCNCEGTAEWLGRTLKRPAAAAPEDTPRLVVVDAAENLQLFSRTPETDFIVKRNLRRSDPAKWLAAQRKTEEPDQLDRGARVWYGERIETVSVDTEQEVVPEEITLRVVWRATKGFADSDGQLLMEPESSIEAYWTSLDWAPEDIQAFYARRGGPASSWQRTQNRPGHRAGGRGGKPNHAACGCAQC